MEIRPPLSWCVVPCHPPGKRSTGHLREPGAGKSPGLLGRLKNDNVHNIIDFCCCISDRCHSAVEPKRIQRKKSEIIRTALVRLLKRPYGAFVIIEDPSTGKYIQFSGSSEEPLFFDLPQQTLTLEEFEKARNLFSELGYPGPETYGAVGPGLPFCYSRLIHKWRREIILFSITKTCQNSASKIFP